MESCWYDVIIVIPSSVTVIKIASISNHVFHLKFRTDYPLLCCYIVGGICSHVVNTNINLSKCCQQLLVGLHFTNTTCRVTTLRKLILNIYYCKLFLIILIMMFAILFKWRLIVRWRNPVDLYWNVIIRRAVTSYWLNVIERLIISIKNVYLLNFVRSTIKIYLNVAKKHFYST